MPEEKKTFWTSIAGILTGIAAVITAVTGLYVAIVGKDQSLPINAQPSLSVEPASVDTLKTTKDTFGQRTSIDISQAQTPASKQLPIPLAESAPIDTLPITQDTYGKPAGVDASQAQVSASKLRPIPPAESLSVDAKQANKNDSIKRSSIKQERLFILKAIIDDPDGYTNVRSTKSVSSDIVTKVYQSEEFYTYIQEGNWWQIKTKDGRVGYMHVSRIKIIKDKK